MGPSTEALAWSWWGRSLPKGNQWECWDPGLGPYVVRLPVHLPPPIHPYTPNAPNTLYTLMLLLMPPIPLLAPEYLHFLSAPNATLIPLTASNLPWCPLKPPEAPWCHLYPCYLQFLPAPNAPLIPLHSLPALNAPLKPPTPMTAPIPLTTLQCPLTPPRSPLMPPIPLLAPEYLHSLPSPKMHPWHPLKTTSLSACISTSRHVHTRNVKL